MHIPPFNVNEKFALAPLLGFMRMRRLHSLEKLASWPLNRFGIRQQPLPAAGETEQDDGLNFGTFISHRS